MGTLTFWWLWTVSKWIEAIACPVCDAKVVIKLFKTIIFPIYGIPRVVISDGGSHFIKKFPKLTSLIARLDECYLGFNNWRPPWGWKRFSLFISKISRFSRTSNDGELEREHSHREPVSLRRKLKRQSTSTIDKSLPAEGRDKPAPTRNPSFSPQRSVSPRRSTSPQRSPPPRKDESPPPSAPRRSRKSSSSDKPRSSKKSSSSEKILKLMENLVKPLADGFESMRAQQKKTQEQVEALAREDDEDPSSPMTEQPPVLRTSGDLPPKSSNG
ncbi:unnamed protein product [Microthlaspi erraticum]|uniref:Integrase catalytic domain-containing protein n=1 Tax=Microthlaspi erraticum TaxID=1685480 RepID=A0A6D2I0J5_9BRAS|nr:unnamed protein product [Microthlaspi erraticum]